MQDAYLAKCAGLRQPSFPKHRVPSVDGFEMALSLGMGWGMVPVAHKGFQHNLHSAGAWMEIWPGQHVDVPLYWHHWAREPQLAAKVTQAVQTAAAAILLPI